MVGINIGAGYVARAKQIAWVSVALGVGLTETIGLLVALSPLSWLHLFSHDPHVLAPAIIYLHIVAPAYGLLGSGFVISFAMQGAGHVLWPYVGSTLRMIIAAGFGLIAVKFLGAGMLGLATIVAASLGAYMLVTAVAMTSRKVWNPNRS